jgi:drug/metabolite transporter (DMT)-like permease
MMRGAIIVITAIMSVVFLKRKQYFHHIISIAVIVTGVALVGYCGIKASEDGTGGKAKTSFFGVMVCIIS